MRKFTKRQLIETWNSDCESEDIDLTNQNFQDLLDNLGSYIKKLNPNGYWKAEVKNFGWRSLDGEKYFQADSGKDFLTGILPNCDCDFNIYKDGKNIAIQNFHHDSPMGNEWYKVKPISEEVYLKNRT